MKRAAIFVFIFLFSISYSFSQEDDSTCKVLLGEISGTYDGACKNGLAHGKGTAVGVDTYVGMFENGLPEGKGKYTYKNGNSYSGYWSKGLKDGKGKFKYSINGETTTLIGYWQVGEYVGTSKPDEFYRITNISSIENYSIEKKEADKNVIVISFERVMSKYIPRDLEISISSGNMDTRNKKIIITRNIYPVNCSLHFTIQTAGGKRQCNFGFDILKPGSYEVFISNN